MLDGKLCRVRLGECGGIFLVQPRFNGQVTGSASDPLRGLPDPNRWALAWLGLSDESVSEGSQAPDQSYLIRRHNHSSGPA